MKNVIIILAVVVVLVGGIYWSKSMQSNNPDIIATRGLHWHPTLKISVKGEDQIIPANIGIGGQYSSLPMGMSPIHTHDDASKGIIHLEFSGVVRREDIRLGKFFEAWGKDIKSFGKIFTVTVNGQPNSDPINYEMKDGDKIVINYE